jgi:predicted dehydrogenase
MNSSARSLITRREFVRSATAVSAAAIAVRGVSAEKQTRKKAVVIGHTGRGDYGHGLESIFNNRPDIEIVAVADPDSTGRAKVATKIGAPRSYADYREMLDREKSNLVSIAMRQADQHHAIALASLRAGAHIYCEKPFVTTPAEADELLMEADKRGLRIAVAHTMRLMPIVTRLKQALAGGLLGELVELRACGKQDTRAGGEDMMVLGSHLFDLLRLLAGDPLSCTARVLQAGRDITRADARLVKDNVGLVAGDSVFAQFAFARGVNATFTSDAKLRETMGYWGIEILGSKGAARINCDLSPLVFIRRTDEWKATGRAERWEPFDPAFVKPASGHNLGPVGDWLEATEKNREPECSGRNGALAVEMVMGVYRAALGGGRVTFPLAQRGHALAAG